jgi:hypothetical protein
MQMPTEDEILLFLFFLTIRLPTHLSVLGFS